MDEAVWTVARAIAPMVNSEVAMADSRRKGWLLPGIPQAGNGVYTATGGSSVLNSRERLCLGVWDYTALPFL